MFLVIPFRARTGMKVTTEDLNGSYFISDVETYRKEHSHENVRLIRKALLKDLRLSEVPKEVLLPVIINFLREKSGTHVKECDQQKRLQVDAEAVNIFEAISTNGKYHIDIVRDNLPSGLVALCDNLAKYLSSVDFSKSTESKDTDKTNSISLSSGPASVSNNPLDNVASDVTAIEDSQYDSELPNLLCANESSEIDIDIDTCLPADSDESIETCLPELDTCLSDVESEGSPPPSPSLLENPEYIAALGRECEIESPPPSPSILDRRFHRRKRKASELQ